MTTFERERRKYKPFVIKYLLVAETPPKADSKRFFYFENVETQDSLFLEAMKCLYPDKTQNVDTSRIRQNKKHLLERFKKDGFYLIDSIETPFEEKYNSKQKEILLKKGQVELLLKIKKYVVRKRK